MKRRPRIYYSASQKALIWERWQKGETLHQIAGLFDRYHSLIQGIVAETGGIRPADRRRSRRAWGNGPAIQLAGKSQCRAEMLRGLCQCCCF